MAESRYESYRTTGQIREFDEDGPDAECVEMRMLASSEADEAMNWRVSERDHPPALLARGATRREAASQ
jgi:hypothetical protein